MKGVGGCRAGAGGEGGGGGDTLNKAIVVTTSVENLDKTEYTKGANAIIASTTEIPLKTISNSSHTHLSLKIT